MEEEIKLSDKARKYVEAITYLKEKKAPFAIKYKYEDNKPVAQTLICEVTKKGKFFRAGSKTVIGHQFASLIDGLKDVYFPVYN